jgi:hypothetical protein
MLYDRNLCAYHLTEAPAHVPFIPDAAPAEQDPLNYRWSNVTVPVPAIGVRVTSRAHNKQSGVVTGYFVEYGWLGIHVTLDKPVTRADGHPYIHVYVFGIDLMETTNA